MQAKSKMVQARRGNPGTFFRGWIIDLVELGSSKLESKRLLGELVEWACWYINHPVQPVRHVFQATARCKLGQLDCGYAGLGSFPGSTDDLSITNRLLYQGERMFPVLLSSIGLVSLHSISGNDAGTVSLSGKHSRTFNEIFAEPIRANISWRDVESLFRALGAEISEGSGSRVRVRLNGRRAVFHRPHPRNQLHKSAVRSVRRFLQEAGVSR